MAKQKKGGKPAILGLTSGIGKRVAKAKPASVRAGRAKHSPLRGGGSRKRVISKSVKQSGLAKGAAGSRRWRKKAY